LDHSFGSAVGRVEQIPLTQISANANPVIVGVRTHCYSKPFTSQLIFFIILPMLFTWIIGMAMQGIFNPDQNSDSRIPLVVINQDAGLYAPDLLDVLNRSEIIRVELKSAEEGKALIADESIQAYLLIPADFSSNIASGLGSGAELTLNPKFSDTVKKDPTVAGLSADMQNYRAWLCPFIYMQSINNLLIKKLGARVAH
jgi:hypothetical protein